MWMTVPYFGTSDVTLLSFKTQLVEGHLTGTYQPEAHSSPAMTLSSIRLAIATLS